METKKFKPGDRVKRIMTSNRGVVLGQEYTVKKQADHTLFLEGCLATYSPSCFILVEPEKPKPWLKVTPPQPEKRELQGFNHGTFYWMNFSPDSTFAYIGWGSHRGSGENQSFTKDELQKFGETLIEISKEMK